nr:hypothetical protein [Propionibacterium sp.]
MRPVLLLTLLALLAGCAATPAASPSASIATVPAARAAELQRTAVALTEAMERGDYASTVALAGDTIRGKVSEQLLADAFAQVVPRVGAYQGITGSFAAALPSGDVVYVVARHANASLRVLFSFEPGGQKLNGIHLNPATDAEIAKASGTPVPTPTYPPTGPHSTDAAVTVGVHGLPGVLTIPAAAEKRPIAVLFLWGSGPQDRDETIGAAGNKPFRDLADALAAQGITSLRFDKRTKAAPETFTAAATLEDEYFADGRAAIALLRERPESAGHRIFVVGHSLGAMVLPAVLAADPELAGGVSLAGSPRSLFDIIHDQTVAAVAASDQSAEAKAAVIAQSRQVNDALKRVTDPAAALPPEAASVYTASYVASLNRLDQGSVARRLTVPLLFCQGDADRQIDPEADFGAWQTLLAGRPNVAFARYPGLNHLFMPTSGLPVPADYDPPATVAPQVGADIAAWLIAHAG